MFRNRRRPGGNRYGAPPARPAPASGPTFVVLQQMPAGVPPIAANERLLLVTVSPEAQPSTVIQVRVENRPFNITVPPRQHWQRGNQFYAKVSLAATGPPPAVRGTVRSSPQTAPRQTVRASPPTAVPRSYGPTPSPPSASPASAPPSERSGPAAGPSGVPTYVMGGGGARATPPPSRVHDSPMAMATVVDDVSGYNNVPIATASASVVGGDAGSERAPMATAAAAAPSARIHAGPQHRVGGTSDYSAANPFLAPPAPESEPEVTWLPGVYFNEFRAQFERAGPVNGKLAPDRARDVLLSTGAPMSTLADVWEIADDDNNGVLDVEEFALAMFLCMQANAGNALPDRTQPLAPELVPPSKRGNPSS